MIQSQFLNHASAGAQSTVPAFSPAASLPPPTVKQPKRFTSLKGHMNVAATFTDSRINGRLVSYKCVTDQIHNAEYFMCGVCESTKLFRSVSSVWKHKMEGCRTEVGVEVVARDDRACEAVVVDLATETLAADHATNAPIAAEGPPDQQQLAGLVESARAELADLPFAAIVREFEAVVGPGSEGKPKTVLIEEIIAAGLGKDQIEPPFIEEATPVPLAIDDSTAHEISLEPASALPSRSVLSNPISSEFHIFVETRGAQLSHQFPVLSADQISITVLSEWNRLTSLRLSDTHRLTGCFRISADKPPIQEALEEVLHAQDAPQERNQEEEETVSRKKPIDDPPLAAKRQKVEKKGSTSNTRELKPKIQSSATLPSAPRPKPGSRKLPLEIRPLRKRSTIKECVACWTCFTEEQLSDFVGLETTSTWYCPPCLSSWVAKLNLVHKPGQLVWFNDGDEWHPAVVEAHAVEDSKDQEGYRLRTIEGSRKASDEDLVHWSSRGLGPGEDRHAAYRWALGFAAKMAREAMCVGGEEGGDQGQGHVGDEPFDSQATVEFGGSI